MSGLLYLTSDDFAISEGNAGKVLCHNIPGFSLILWYSTSCQHCHELIPIFKNLPGSIGGCQFGMINVSTNRQCVNLSKNTIAPITYVPYIVLYVNGRPFMKYNGPRNPNSIKQFIIEVANNMKTKRQFTNENSGNQPQQPKIPEYSAGIPFKEDDVCFLEFDNAYGKN